jgi:uncharacterized protein (TIGR03437 family)
VDSVGNAYLTGTAADKTPLPVTPGALQPGHGDSSCVSLSPHQPIPICYDAFVMKLNETGSVLLYSSYLGGNGSDNGQSIELDAAGNIYITGGISSSSFPVTPNALKAMTPNGFVSKLKIEARSASVATVSAANYLGPQLAQESLAVGFLDAFGHGADRLGVKLKDSAGAEREATVLFSGAGQVNFQIPQGTTAGPATVRVLSGGAAIASGAAQIVAVAPGVFAMNANGRGVAAAVVQRVKADGSQGYEMIAHFDQSLGQWVSIPIDLGPERDQVFLAIFGTGWRFRTSEAAVKVAVGGVEVPVVYAGLQPTLVGVDQINARLPRALAGRGEVDLVVMVDGRTANTVRINIR